MQIIIGSISIIRMGNRKITWRFQYSSRTISKCHFWLNTNIIKPSLV